MQISGRNRMFRRMASDAIRKDPDWMNGGARAAERGLTSAIYTGIFMSSAPLRWQKQAPTRDTADAFFDEMVTQRLASADANDFLYQFESSRDYNPQPDLEKIVCPLVAELGGRPGEPAGTGDPRGSDQAREEGAGGGDPHLRQGPRSLDPFVQGT